MNQNKAYSIFGRQVGYIITSNLIVLVLGIIQIPIITKSLGASLYGTWSLIGVTVSLIISFSTLSFPLSIVRFLAAEKDKNKIREDFFSACSIVLMSGVIFSLLLFLCSGFIATHIFKDSSQVRYIRIGSLLVLLNSMFIVLTAFFRMGTKIGIFTILNLSLNVFSFGLIMLFVLYGYALTGILVATIIGLIAINIVALVIIFKQIGFQRPRFSNMKSYLKWGIPLTPNSAIMWIIQASDRYIIVYFLGVSAAGIYNVASSIGSYASFTLLPIAMVLYPIISKTYDEKNLEECSNYFKYSFKYLMMVTIPAAVGLSILAKPLLQILTSAEFISGSSVVVITAFGALFNCLQQICSYVMHLSGKTHVNLILLSIAAALNIIFNIILIPHLGIFGAGISYFLSYVVLGLLTLMVTSRYLKFELSLLFLIKSLVASAIMALCIWLLKPESLTMVGLSVVAGIAVYFVILIIIRGFNKTELAFFVSFIKKVNSV